MYVCSSIVEPSGFRVLGIVDYKMVPIGAQTAEAIGDPIAARACAPVRTHPYA